MTATSEEEDSPGGLLRNEFVRWGDHRFPVGECDDALLGALLRLFHVSQPYGYPVHILAQSRGWPRWSCCFGGGPLFRKAWWGLRHRAPGMETLVCMGAGSAYLYSLYHFALKSWHLYFDTATMLITLVLLGKLLESRVKTNVRRDLEGFPGLAAQQGAGG